MFNKIVAYVKEAREELKKVTWPTREETRRLTLVVLGVTIAFSIGLGLLNSLLGYILFGAIGGLLGGLTVKALRRAGYFTYLAEKR